MSRPGTFIIHGPPRSGVTRDPRRTAAEAFVRRVQERLPGRLLEAYLFGSVARGDADAESDVDVFLVVDHRHEPTIRRLYGIAEEVSVELDADLSLRILDQSEFARRQTNPLVQAVKREGIALA